MHRGRITLALLSLVALFLFFTLFSVRFDLSHFWLLHLHNHVEVNVAWLMFIGALVFGIYLHVEPFFLRVRRFTIASRRLKRDSIRIAHFSDTHACSTSYIVYQLITALAGPEAITKAMAESLYVGLMTDTGNFAYSNLDADLFRAVATLIDRGINVPYIYSAVYNNFSEGRMRLMGYMLNDKMTLLWKHGTAYMWLTEEEMRRFNFKQGDSEGFVNFPLSIRGISLSAMFTQNQREIRVSLRSRGDVDVNVFARRYFGGGGHRNAAGGKSSASMEETIRHFERSVAEYFGELPPTGAGAPDPNAPEEPTAVTTPKP